jgi:two-component system sensor histidine kinase EvgS
MRRIVAGTVGALLAILCALQALAQDLPLSPSQQEWLQAHPNVTVAVYTRGWAPFEDWPDAQPRGLSLDYLTEVLARLGLKPRYRAFDSWPEMLRSACDGEVDLVMNVSMTAERTECLAFTREYVQVPVAIVSRLDDARPVRSTELKGLHIVTERGFATGEAARDRYPQATHTYVDLTLEALQAVADGTADVYVGNAYVASHLIATHHLAGIGLIRVSELSMYPLHFAAPNANRPLIESINTAMQAIPPARRETIELKWLPDLKWINEDDSVFTPNEEAALAGTLAFGFPPQSGPISFRGDNGQPMGLVAEYLQRFQDMGANLEPLQARTWQDVRDAMREGRVDAVVTVINPLDADREWMHSLPIVSIPNVIVTRSDSKESILELRDLASARVAVSDPERLENLVSRTARGATFVRASDPRHGLDLVRSRDADVYVGNLAVVDALIRDRYAGELRVAAPAGIDDTFVFAARTRHALAVSAFDRMLVSMSPRERESIRGDWLSVEYRGGIDWSRTLRWLLPALMALGIIVLMHARGYRRLQREVEHRRTIEKRFAEVTANLPAVVYQATLSGSGDVTFPFVVGDLPSMFGVTIEEAMEDGESVIARIDPTDMARVREAIGRAMSDRRGIDVDFRVVTDGGRRWIRSNSLPYQTEVGSWHWTGYWIDVTDQRRQWEELVEAKSSAEEAVRAKADFLAMMSHEIRTPMSGVVGLLEVLCHTPLDEEQQAIVDTIEDSARMLRQILDDILDYSKLEAGALALDAEPFSLRDVVHGVVRMLEPLSNAKQLDVEVTIDPSIAMNHVGDDVRFRQILFNLLSNAIKFTEQGRVEVVLSLEEGLAGAQCIGMAVSDTGIGIAEERQEKLFQPFTQAESSTTRRYGGTGLGLSICQRIASLMGGTISLRSRPGEGTTVTFEVMLPVASATELCAVSARSQVSPRLSAAVDEAGVKVLIAEDHPTNRTLMAWYMQQLGLSFHMVENGLEALKALDEGPYDLLITDGLMPVMNGYELTEEIRRREAQAGGHRLPIIAITASAYKGEAELCSKAGMDGYLAKPVSLETLARTLDHWLKVGISGTTSARDAGIEWTCRDPLGHDVLRSLVGQYGSLRVAMEMLQSFCDATRTDIESLRSLGEDSRTGLADVIHHIAGGLYAIKQMGLGDQAKALEHKLVRTSDPTREEVNRLVARLESLVAEIAAHLASASPQGTGQDRA